VSGNASTGLAVQVNPHIASMGIYVIKASVMKELLLKAYVDANDFGSEIIPGAVAMGKRVQAYLFEGYWEDIGTIGAFYSSQLALLQENAPFSFYDTQAPVFSMSRYLPPSRINVCLATSLFEAVAANIAAHFCC
jgi:glucose-1-phosphate adenylyltransferase